MTARTKLAALENTGSLLRITAAVLLAWLASRLFPHSPVSIGPDQLLILSVLAGLYGYCLATRALDYWLSPVMDRIEDEAAAQAAPASTGWTCFVCQATNDDTERCTSCGV